MRPAALAAAVVSSLAAAIWLGGLLALGAIVAPTVFHNVSYPENANAMTLVFRRFDLVAMACAAAALAGEALRVALRVPSGRLDRVRAGVTALAAALATFQGTNLSPQIASLHASGVVRGVGAGGMELSRLHDLAEACGKAEVLLLVVLVALQVTSLARIRREGPRMP